MRALALLMAAGLTLIGTASIADAAGRHTTRYPAWVGNGPPYGGYYRSVPLTRYSFWIHDGPPYGGYYRTVPAAISFGNIYGVGARSYFEPRRF
jgi:hypothetical protein